MSNVSVIQQWFTILNNHQRISLFILLEANRVIHTRGSRSGSGGWWPSVFLPLKVNRANIHCPRGPLCYQQHKDSHPCSPVIPTCISNDFQKKSKRESTVALSFHWRQTEKALSLKSVAWFTVFSPLSICALPFWMLLFPCLLFLWFITGSLLLPFFGTIWSLKRSTVISIQGSMQPPLWNVFGAVWINVLRRHRWVPGNSSRQNAIQFWFCSQTIYRDKHQTRIYIYGEHSLSFTLNPTLNLKNFQALLHVELVCNALRCV